MSIPTPFNPMGTLGGGGMPPGYERIDSVVLTTLCGFVTPLVGDTNYKFHFDITPLTVPNGINFSAAQGVTPQLTYLSGGNYSGFFVNRDNKVYTLGYFFTISKRYQVTVTQAPNFLEMDCDGHHLRVDGFAPVTPAGYVRIGSVGSYRLYEVIVEKYDSSKTLAHIVAARNTQGGEPSLALVDLVSGRVLQNAGSGHLEL